MEFGIRELPPPETKIWRYIDFPKFVSLIDSSALYFSRTDLLEDEWEGALTLRAKKDQPRAWGDRRPTPTAIRKHNLGVKQWTFVNCWHMNESESVALWRQYGSSGIALQSTYGRLRACLPDVIDVEPVIYLDFINDSIRCGDQAIAPFITKRKCFEHERELRALVLYDCPESEDWTDPNPKRGHLVPLDLRRLVERVCVAPKAGRWMTDLVRNVVHRYGLELDVQDSAIDASPIF